MADPVFVNGLPAQIARTDFRSRFGASYPDLLKDSTNDLVDQCIEDVYTMYAGVQTLWAAQTPDIYFHKTQLCMLFLLAWYIADMYPTYCIAVAGTGGMALKSKSIGGVKVVFGMPGGDGIGANKKYRDTLAGLLTNKYGKFAYDMIMQAVKKLSIYQGLPQ